MRNTRKRSSLLVVYLLLPMLLLAQVNVSEKLQLSKTASSTENALYFIDFWATWCGPCVYAAEYLGVLQKQYPDQFYVVSLSEENPEVIKRYLKKRSTELAVFIDYNGETFKKYAITSLPHGVLLNAKGKVLWKGSVADFKAKDLQWFLKQNSEKIALDKFFKVLKDSNDISADLNYVPKKDFEFKELKEETFQSLEVDDSFEYINIKGRLQDILAYGLKVHSSQIDVVTNSNALYQVYIKKNTAVYKDQISAIVSAFNLEMTRQKVMGDVLTFNIKEPTFWDTNQINWGKNAPHYLIDDEQLQGDNVSLKEVMYQLGILLNRPVVCLSDINVHTLHDWQIHYKFFALMQPELIDLYGIQVERNSIPHDKYIFSNKKTP
ncbi:MAG: redoxin family protein [Bizionia sp.]|nr:redoxin family protein [Bizionia sp.]